jgi:hypothetical protein
MRPSVASPSASDSSTSDAAARVSPANRRTPTRVLSANGRCASAFVVPRVSRCPAGQPGPAQGLLRSDLFASEGAQRLPYCRRPDRGPLGDQRCNPVEKKIGSSRRRWRRRRGECCRRDLSSATAASHATRENRCVQRVEIGLTGESHVQRLESLRRREQQEGRLASALRSEGDSGAKGIDLGPSEFVERTHVRARNERERLVEGTCLELRLRGGQLPPRPKRGV